MTEHSKEVKVLVAQSCQTLCDPMDSSLQALLSMGLPVGKVTGVGCHSRLSHTAVLISSSYAFSLTCFSHFQSYLSQFLFLLPSPMRQSHTFIT